MFTVRPSTYKASGHNTTATTTASTNSTSIQATSTSQLNATSTSPPACLSTIHIQPFMGFNFNVLCDSDLYQHDLNNGPASSIEDCVDTCNHTPGCFGVTWTSSNMHCYRKTTGVSINDTKANPGVVSVLPDLSGRNQTAKDLVCPVPNLTRQPTKAGLDFKVLCGSTLWGDDLYDPTKEAHEWMYAKSLQECMENCANNHPLCSRVTYDADQSLEMWSNCWLKSGTSQAKPTPAAGAMRHSAYALLPTLQPVTCGADALVTAGDGRIFKSSCQDRRSLNDTTVAPISISHTPSLDACMDKCTDAKANCSAAAFDVGLQSGYQNCYLFNSLPPPLEHHSNYTFMYLESLASHFLAPPPGPRGSLNKGEIAASVTIPCAAVLISFAIYWVWYRRHKKQYAPVKGD